MKMFAVLKDNILVDGWIADSLEEAQSDNPIATVIEITIENSPWTMGKDYSERIKSA